MALSYWTASSVFIAVIWINHIRLPGEGARSRLDFVLAPLDITIVVGLPSLLAGLVAFLLRERPTWAQLVTSTMFFVVAAPATALMTEWIRFASSSDSPHEGFYMSSVALSFIYAHVPLLIATLIILAVSSLVRGFRLRNLSSE